MKQNQSKGRTKLPELLSPTVDFIFKNIFGTKDNQDLLLSFLNAVFEDAGQPLVESVEILNPFLEKDALSDKMSVLDVKARTPSGTLVNVEIQVRNERDMEKRTLYYWAKMFQGQLLIGQNYRDLHKAITINVLDFNYLPTTRYHSTFKICEEITGLVLTDLFEIHFIELRRLEDQLAIGQHRQLVLWLLFLITQTSKGLEDLAMQEPAIHKAVSVLEFLSQDKRTRELYEERQKGLMTYTANIEGAREEGEQIGIQKGLAEGEQIGIQKGLAEGEQIGIQKIAQAMLRAGDSVEKIMIITGLTRSEIDTLQTH